jgi:hypothetical protein
LFTRAAEQRMNQRDIQRNGLALSSAKGPMHAPETLRHRVTRKPQPVPVIPISLAPVLAVSWSSRGPERVRGEKTIYKTNLVRNEQPESETQ